MIKISKTSIKNLASNEIAYARGVGLYKNNKIASATWSNSANQYSMIVNDNYKYTVNINSLIDGDFNYKCNCISSIKEVGACRHVISALLFIKRYEELSKIKNKISPEERKIYQIVDYFSLSEEDLLIGDTYSIKVTINIPKILKSNNSMAAINLHSGHSRMYKIQSIRKFLNSLYLGEDIIIGKEFNYIDGESVFDNYSLKILDYLLSIFEIQSLLETGVKSIIFNRADILLTKSMLIKLLKIQAGKPFNLNLYNIEYKDVIYKEENPPIIYHLSLDEESVVVDFRENKPVIALISTGELLLYDNILYKPDKDFLKNFQPFYNNLGPNKEPFVFSGEYKTGFLEYVLPQMSNSMKLDIPEGLKDRYVTHDLSVDIYFDIHKASIKATVVFKYGEFEFNSFLTPVSDGYIVVRQRENEAETLKLLLDMGFIPYKNYYILKNEDAIYDFITMGIIELQDKAQLFYSKDFKNININSIGKVSSSVRINQGINMLELDLLIDNVPKEELVSLFNSFKLKKKYYRLKNGTFIKNNGDLDQVSNILNNIGISFKELSNETILIDTNKAIYIDKILSEADIDFKKTTDYTKFVDKILNPIKTNYKVPDEVSGILKSYQVVGYKWLRTLVEHGLGGILADDMGLGKTLQAISLIASKLDKSPYLIICPSSLIYNWLDEIENFTPFIKAVVISGTPSEREEILSKYKEYNVLITSYPLMRRDISLYSDIEFETIFIDEAQYIKNATSQISQSVKQLKGRTRIALTGTPIENNLSELWSIFDFIMPSYLDTYLKFSKNYEKPIMKNDKNVLEDLLQKTEPFILRRMKKEVLTELPDKYERKIITELNDDQKEVYNSYLLNIRDELKNEIDNKGFDKSRMKVLAALTRLRQICCHPLTFIENYQGGSGKLDLLMEIIPAAIKNDHRILVFSQFTSMLEIIEKELIKENIDYFYISGSTLAKDRMEYVKDFNGGIGKVFLISLKAGGTGLNLTGADMVIHYDPWWNPAVEEQATDRAYRIGQENKVEVIKIITKGTIEEKIYKLQESKKKLLDSVISSREVFINNLSKDELENLFL